MAATITTAAQALKDALTTIAGLRVYDHIADSFQTPAAMVAIETVDYHQAFRGGDSVYTFRISLLVARTDDRTAQRKLEAFLSYSGDQSIRQAIEADPTLGLKIQTCVVTSGGNIAAIQVNEATYLGVDFDVTVHP